MELSWVGGHVLLCWWLQSIRGGGHCGSITAHKAKQASKQASNVGDMRMHGGVEREEGK